MEETMEPQQQELNLTTVRIIWVAMILSLGLFGFGLTQMSKIDVMLPQGLDLKNQAQLISGLGFSSLLIAVFLYRTQVVPMDDMTKRGTGYIMTWAMLETVALMGFAGSFIASNGFFYLMNAGVALVGYLMTFPQEKNPGVPKRPYV
jgi:hypothetical protein